MLSNLEIIEWKKFRGQPKLEDAVGRVQFGIFWIQIFPNWTSRVNLILSARLLSFNFYELFSKGLIWIVSERAFLYKFKKNRIAGLSQSNARKYNRQCNLANQHKVPVTTRQKKFRWLTKKILLVQFGNNWIQKIPVTPNWTRPTAYGCPRKFFHPIISKLDSM